MGKKEMPMNVTIRLEGTAEEIGNALKALSYKGVLNATALELNGSVMPAVAKPEAADIEEVFVSTEFAKRALQRLPLSRPMKSVLKKLYETHPGSLSTEELHDVADYTPPQFAGLMGAFGRRLANTSGYDGEKEFFVWRWNEDNDAWDCRLPDSVCKALEESFPKKFPTSAVKGGSTKKSE